MKTSTLAVLTQFDPCSVRCVRFNSLPDGKILDWSNLKAFADDNINVAEMMISLSDRIENIVGKGENAGYQHFLLFPQCFPNTFFPQCFPNTFCSGSLKVGNLW